MPQPITATFKVDAGHVASPSGGFRPVIPDESLDGREPTTSQDGDVSITGGGFGWDEGPDGDTAIAGREEDVDVGQEVALTGGSDVPLGDDLGGLG